MIDLICTHRKPMRVPNARAHLFEHPDAEEIPDSRHTLAGVEKAIFECPHCRVRITKSIDPDDRG